MAGVTSDCVAVYVYRQERDGRVSFLQLRRTEGEAVYGAVWSPVYGGIEPGETAVQTALRELEEETGLRPRFMFQVERLESFYFRHQDRVMLMPVFGAEVDGADEIALNGEHDAFRWIPQEQVPEAFMWRTQRESIEVLLDHLQHPGLAMRYLEVRLDGLEGNAEGGGRLA